MKSISYPEGYKKICIQIQLQSSLGTLCRGDESGLRSALPWYTQGLEERSGFQISLDVSEEFGRLTRDKELVVFRLVQECLTNIHRHSGSKTAAIRIARQDAGIAVDMQDRGKGMSPERLASVGKVRRGHPGNAGEASAIQG